MSSSARSSSAPLGAAELEERCEQLLGAVLSSRRTAAAIAGPLATQPRAAQEFTLHWVAVAARSSPEIAWRFAVAAPAAVDALGAAGTEQWLLAALDQYDRAGLQRASAVLQDLPAYLQQRRGQAGAVGFEEVSRVLELFLGALAGRPVKVAPGDTAWTDTEVVYLPRRMARFGTRVENLRAYRVSAALLWAQARHGSFALDALRYPASEHELAWLGAFESARLSARFERDLPGLHRDLERLRDPAFDARVAPAARALRAGSSVADSLAALDAVPARLAAPDWAFLGRLDPQRAIEARTARLARDTQRLHEALARMQHEVRERKPGAPAPRVRVALGEAGRDGDATGEELDIEVELDGRAIDAPPEVAALVASILQDAGELPEEFSGESSAGGYYGDIGDAPDELVAGAEPAPGARLYDEWDFRRRHYRKAWCVLTEHDVQPGDARFVAGTLARYRGEVRQLRRSFELLRGEDRRLRGEPWGDEIDLDAVVRGVADLRAGAELGERLFVRRERKLRDVAVMFVVDMSGSTKGWINDCERESLVLLAQALEVLGDRYAIYGFSGVTRKRCEVYRVKRFDEPYGTPVEQRIAGIQPLDYTRMGVALRHLTRILGAESARTRLMITLSDGKPDDFSDGYRGEYGIEDTRQALLEARRAGIHSFCITIDRAARDYLPRMYGAAHYTVIEDAGRLPLKVAEVYRWLTS